MSIAGAEANVKVDYPTEALRQAQNKPQVNFYHFFPKKTTCSSLLQSIQKESDLFVYSVSRYNLLYDISFLSLTILCKYFKNSRSFDSKLNVFPVKMA